MRSGGERSSRRQAWLLLLALAVALAIVVGLSVPWSAWPGAGALDVRPGRDFTAEQIARAEQFHQRLRVPVYASLALGLVVWLLLSLSPAGSTLARAIGGRLRRWPLQVAAAAATLIAVVRLVRLPLDAWTESLLREYGLSTQSWASWSADLARGWALASVVASISLVVLVGLARRAPQRWFLPGALAAAVLVGAGSYLYPVVVEPLYSDFQPMQAGPLRSSLLRLAEQDGVDVDEVLVADASRRTTALNAYVSGLGSTRRIVVFDTLLAEASGEEVRQVVAHELGHTENRDVLVKTAIGALAASIAVVVLWFLLRSTWLLRRSGTAGAGDPAVVALVLALTALAALLGSPAEAAISRRLEARADLHALALTGDPETFIAMKRRSALTNLADLDPPKLSYLWFASHPTSPERIALARRWAAAHAAGSP